MLLSLVTLECRDAETLWGFIVAIAWRDERDASASRAMVEYAIHYFRDFVLREKFREAERGRTRALIDLRDALSQLPPTRAEAIQDVVYESAAASRSWTEKKGKDGSRRLARLVQHAL